MYRSGAFRIGCFPLGSNGVRVGRCLTFCLLLACAPGCAVCVPVDCGQSIGGCGVAADGCFATENAGPSSSGPSATAGDAFARVHADWIAPAFGGRLASHLSSTSGDAEYAEAGAVACGCPVGPSEGGLIGSGCECQLAVAPEFVRQCMAAEPHPGVAGPPDVGPPPRFFPVPTRPVFSPQPPAYGDGYPASRPAYGPACGCW